MSFTMKIAALLMSTAPFVSRISTCGEAGGEGCCACDCCNSGCCCGSGGCSDDGNCCGGCDCCGGCR